MLTRPLRRQWAVVEVGATVLGVFVVATFLRAFRDVGVSEHSPPTGCPWTPAAKESPR